MIRTREKNRDRAHEGGETRLAGRIETSREQLELFAASLALTDGVVLEATGPAFAIARILAPHVAEVVVANASEVRAISHARVKSDDVDARTLARLLWAGMLVSVWVPGEEIGALRRRVARRASLVRQCTRAKNEIHGALARCLLGKAPVSDLFGVQGRAWLAEQSLPADEGETVAGCLAQIAFCDQQIIAIDRQLAQFAVGSQDARRLMTIPGIGVCSAVTLIAAIGTSRALRIRASSSATSAWIPRSASPATAPRAVARSASAATPRPARSSSRPPGPRCAPPARCARSANAFRPARAPRSPPSPSRARSPSWRGIC